MDKDSSMILEEVYFHISRLLRIKDMGTFGHCRRVAEVGSAFSAYRNDLFGQTRHDIYMIFFLHDGGKIVMTKAMLRGTKSLDPTEHILKDIHSRLGAELIPDEAPLVARHAALYHHERFDGNGYPEGLKGKKIPEIGRIVCVIDSWDAMLGDRPYKKKKTLRQVWGEFKENQGTQFDPDILDSFRRFLLSKKSGAEGLLISLYPDIFKK